MKRILICWMMVMTLNLQAQDDFPWQTYDNLYGTMDDSESEEGELIQEQLEELADTKINLNTATREELEQLFFLSERQIEEIVEYVYRYGPVRSLAELAMIESIDAQQRQLLQAFLYIDMPRQRNFPSLDTILRNGRNEIMATMKIPFYNRKGDRNGYLGPKYKHWTRYMFSYGKYVKAGITLAQDAGEPFFAHRNSWGYDYCSPYLLVRNLGRIKAIAIGRYRLKFGMGLVMNRDLIMGKTTMLSSIGYNANVLKAHSSRTDARYLQGAAATIALDRNLDLTLFLSSRRIDATLTKDSTGIATLLTSGLHRTESELNRKHNAIQSTGGANLSFRKNGFRAGLTALAVALDKPLKPDTRQVFRYHYPAGKNFWNVSADYGYIAHRINFHGETATGNSGNMATINRIVLMPSAAWELSAIQRFYSYRYNALLSGSFSDAGRVQNENGLLVGVNCRPMDKLSFMAYTDYAYHAWPLYGSTAASHAWDHLLAAGYEKGKVRINTRYRLRRRQRDSSNADNILTWKTEQRARISATVSSQPWQWDCQADFSHTQHDASSSGWMVTQRLAYSRKRWRADASIAYFHTDDYDSRLYAYERSVLYDFCFPVFSGKGLRWTMNLRADFSDRLMACMKISSTKYFDRNSISTGLQQIDQSSKTDLDLQLRWRF